MINFFLFHFNCKRGIYILLRFLYHSALETKVSNTNPSPNPNPLLPILTLILTIINIIILILTLI